MRLLFPAAPWCLAALLLAGPARGETIYQFRDAKGGIHLSNRKLDAHYQPMGSMRLPDGTDQGKVVPFIRYYCRRYGVDPNLVRAMVEVESGFAVAAVSPKGAAGLMQIMPGTGRDLGLADAFDGANNLEAGIRYMRSLLDAYGDARLALAAYNAGPGRVRRGGEVPDIPETRAYVEKVLARSGLR
ncbi:Lytic transglycosylase catalytic [Solidesulfovibrio carbinoliphilus subsp. oakridgensis]|uniref:Lytic transglycosylase catalytic n=1 Tax=Solidesulfovibrio carbinoliphilus subsp. oakridgensis TaxID=694327 RepID=G7Q8V3_9BACT|nr:lytic transglycosylase domain-containing protein [Solidesulfovibrio carbinoliphilus]EHJ47439.1 Lytic transglycosylase catalytic [Solidesulfovibrio carbinoliphilus subsp. oakridgensis]